MGGERRTLFVRPAAWCVVCPRNAEQEKYQNMAQKYFKYVPSHLRSSRRPVPQDLQHKSCSERVGKVKSKSWNFSKAQNLESPDGAFLFIYCRGKNVSKSGKWRILFLPGGEYIVSQEGRSTVGFQSMYLIHGRDPLRSLSSSSPLAYCTR